MWEPFSHRSRYQIGLSWFCWLQIVRACFALAFGFIISALVAHYSILVVYVYAAFTAFVDTALDNDLIIDIVSSHLAIIWA